MAEEEVVELGDEMVVRLGRDSAKIQHRWSTGFSIELDRQQAKKLATAITGWAGEESGEDLVFPCVICKTVLVNASRGYDTCEECTRRV